MATVKENAALRECPVSQPFAMNVLKLETRSMRNTISVRNGGSNGKYIPVIREASSHSASSADRSSGWRWQHAAAHRPSLVEGIPEPLAPATLRASPQPAWRLSVS